MDSRLNFNECVTDSAPLSAEQQGIWVAQHANAENATYHIHVEFNVDGYLDRSLLARTIDSIIARHASLRTTITESDGEPWQVVHEPALLEIPVLDIRGLEVDVASWPTCKPVVEFIRRPWDLKREWPLRTAMVELPGKRSGFMLVLHHIASDARSLDIIFEEFASLYKAYSRGDTLDFVPLSMQYVDIARRQHSPSMVADISRKLDRWRETLQGAPQVMTLPLDRNRSSTPAGAAGAITVPIDGQLTDTIRQLAMAERTTPFVIFLAAYAITLEAFGADEDMLIATPTDQRGDDETRNVVGCLTNLAPLRVHVSGAANVRDLIHELRTTILTVLDLRDVPFDSLLKAMNVRRRAEVSPLIQVSIRMTTGIPDQIDLGDIRLIHVSSAEVDPVKFDLSLAIEQRGDELSARIEFRRDLFEEDTAGRLADSFGVILRQISEDPQLRIRDIQTMPNRDLRKVLEHWNPTRIPTRIPTGTTDSQEPARCYVLDRHGRPTPIAVPGELFVAGVGELPDPFAGHSGAVMSGTGIMVRWERDGILHVVRSSGSGAASAKSASKVPLRDPHDYEPAILLAILDIWRNLLNVDQVSDRDDFFELGGDSLLAIRLISRARKAFKVKLTLKEIFTAPTPAEQAGIVELRRVR